MNNPTTYYTVGEICILTGVTRKTLFYYDRIDLLRPVRRTGAQKHKLYDNTSLEQLRQIIEYRDAGLQIAEIRQLVSDPECNKKEILENALKRITEQKSEKEKEIRRLQDMIAGLRQ